MSLCIGLDLCDDYLTAFEYENKTMINVPAVICREKKDDLWYIGEGAYRMALSGKGVLTDKLLSLLKKGGTSTIARKAYTAEQLLSRMIAALLWQLQGGGSPESIDRLVITMHETDRAQIDSVIRAVSAAGIPRDRIRIISHSDAFVYYTLSGSRDMYANLAALFDLSEESLSFYKMKAVRGISKNSVVVENMDLEENFRLGILKTASGAELADRIMTDAARRCMAGDIYSSVMLTGKGFESTDWARGFIEFACRKRRVIYEKGLFAIGAACCGAEDLEGGEPGYLIFSDTAVAAEINMEVTAGGRRSRLVLAGAGQPWYSTASRCELMPFGQDYIEINVEPVDRFASRKKIRIGLESLEKRPDRCTRLSLELDFKNAQEAEVRVRDLGFGEIYPATDTVITESFALY